jgi:hypothetical protein
VQSRLEVAGRYWEALIQTGTVGPGVQQFDLDNTTAVLMDRNAICLQLVRTMLCRAQELLLELFGIQQGRFLRNLHVAAYLS